MLWIQGYRKLEEQHPQEAHLFGINNFVSVYGMISGYNYLTFPKEGWWIHDGTRSKWVCVGRNGMFEFRLPRVKDALPPQHREIIKIHRTIGKLTVVLTCLVDEIHLQTVDQVGMRVSKSCGRCVLNLIAIDSKVNL